MSEVKEVTAAEQAKIDKAAEAAKTKAARELKAAEAKTARELKAAAAAEAKAAKLANKKVGVGDVAKQLIRDGKTNEEVLEAIKDQFPEAKTTMASVNWYRNNLRTNGTDADKAVKTARELKAASQPPKPTAEEKAATKAAAKAAADLLKAEKKAAADKVKADKAEAAAKVAAEAAGAVETKAKGKNKGAKATEGAGHLA